MNGNSIVYWTLLPLCLELMAMVYIYRLRPYALSNRIFAVYMVVLALANVGNLIASTASEPAVALFGGWLYAVATLASPPLFWPLLLAIFISHKPNFRWFVYFFVGLALLPVLPLTLDWLAGTQYLADFGPSFFEQEFLLLWHYLQGAVGPPLYLLYIFGLNYCVLIPLLLFSFWVPTTPVRRRAARAMLVAVLVLNALLVVLIFLNEHFAGLATPFVSAFTLLWAANLFSVFSPVPLALRRAVDTASFGLVIIDTDGLIVDANKAAYELLPLSQRNQMPFIEVLAIAREQALNQEASQSLQAPISWQQPLEVELVLPALESRVAQRWLQLRISPLFSREGAYVGATCTVEDLSAERRSQAQIAEANRNLAQDARKLKLLNEITKTTISVIEFEEMLQILADRLGELFEADGCYITLWDEERQRVIPKTAHGPVRETFKNIVILPGEPTITEAVLARGRPLIIEDVHDSPYTNPRISPQFPTRSMLALPLVAGEQNIGAALISFHDEHTFSEEEIQWGEQVAGQIALAVATIKLLHSEREERAMAQALQVAGNILSETLDFETVLDRLLDQIEKVVPYDSAYVCLIDGSLVRFVRMRGCSESPLDLETYTLEIEETWTLATMMREKRPLLITDVDNEDRWVPIEPASRVKSWVGAPIIVDNEAIAFLFVDKTTPNFYRSSHAERLAAFADQASIALQHAQLFTELNRRATDLKLLSDLSATLQTSNTMAELLPEVLQEIMKAVDAPYGTLFLRDAESNAVVSRSSWPLGSYPQGISFQPGEGITGYVAQTGEIYISEDFTTDPKRQERVHLNTIKTTVAIPLQARDEIVGVIHLGMTTARIFNETEKQMLNAIADIVASGLQRVQIMETLEERVEARTRDLEEANKRLQELDRLKTKFIADVSHELRTPVTNMNLYLDLLQEGRPEKRMHYLNVMKQQTRRLIHLVEETLQLTRLDLVANATPFTAVCLNAIIQEAVTSHMPQAEKRGIDLRQELAEPLPPVWGDSNLLAKVVTNLLANALNYTEAGHVALRTRQVDHSVCLVVEDTGIGIEASEIPHLYERFYRGQQTGQSNIPGTGLGLAIVRDIVQLHNGRIQVQSQVGQGSVFMVFLPISSQTTRNGS